MERPNFKLKWKFKVLEIGLILIYATIFHFLKWQFFHNNTCNEMQIYLLNIEELYF